MNWTQDNLAYYVAIAAAFIAVFYLLLAASRMLGLYLRWIDRLPIEADDFRPLLDSVGMVVFWGGVALLFRALPFWMAVAAMSCVWLFYQLWQVSKKVRTLKKL